MLWIEQMIETTDFNLYRIGLEMAQQNGITCRVLRYASHFIKTISFFR